MRSARLGILKRVSSHLIRSLVASRFCSKEICSWSCFPSSSCQVASAHTDGGLPCNIRCLENKLLVFLEDLPVAIYRDGVQVKYSRFSFRGRYLQSPTNPAGSKNSSRNVQQVGKKIYFVTPELQLVRMDGAIPIFPERVLLDDVEDFLVDENQTITYLTSQGELRQENPDNSSIPKTCVNLLSLVHAVSWTCLERVVIQEPHYVIAGHSSQLNLSEFALFDSALKQITTAQVSLFNPVSRMKALPMPTSLDYRLIYFAVEQHMDANICVVHKNKLYLLLDCKKILDDLFVTDGELVPRPNILHRYETQIMEVIGDSLYFGGQDVLKRVVFKY